MSLVLLIRRGAVMLATQGTAVLPLNLSWIVSGRNLEHSEGPDDFRHIFVLESRLDWTHRDRGQELLIY